MVTNKTAWATWTARAGVAWMLVGCWSAVQAKEFLFVHNTRSGEISKISIPEHEVVASFPVGLYMDYLAPSPDGKVLYVNRIESLAPEQKLNIGESGELIALDPVAGTILWRVQLDGMPHHMSVSKDGRYVFVPFYDTWWMAVVDTETREVTQKVFLGHGSHGTKLSKDGRRLYVGSMMNDTISVVDTKSLEVIGRIPFDDGVRPFALTADESTLYVQLSRHHSFEVVDVADRSVTRRVDMPTLPAGTETPRFYPHNVNHGIALNFDESLLLANGSIADYVAVYSHPGLELKAQIPTGDDPNSISFSGDGKFAYVSNRGSNDLSIIDLETLEETKRLPLGEYPQRMAVIDIPEDAEPAPRPRVTATTAPAPEASPDLEPRPSRAQVSAVTRSAAQQPTVVVMQAPMILDLAVGSFSELPDGYAWRTQETQNYEVDSARILETRVSQQQQKKGRKVKISLDFFSTKKAQRLDVEVKLTNSGNPVATVTAVASAGRRLAEQLNNGKITRDLLITMDEADFQAVFGEGGRPGLTITVNPK